MALNAEFRAVLEAGDVKRVRAAWGQIAPHLPQPKTNREAEMMLHYARTEAQSISFPKRAYSHQWLTERNLPSALPDHLKPKAHRMYPVVVRAVGIACKTSNPLFKPAALLIRGVMERAVLECYADRKTDPVFVKSRMLAARARETQRLFGALAIPHG